MSHYNRHTMTGNGKSGTDVTASFRQPDYPVDRLFVERWSPRAYLEKNVPADQLLQLFEAARWAPSAFNLQPWRFIALRTQQEKESLYPCISENNLTWCRHAPVLVLIVADTEVDGKVNPSHAFDTGAAWGYFALAAHMQGLATHPMTGFDFELARQIMQIPDRYAIQALVAVGYQGPAEQLPDSMRQREYPKGRRPVADSVYVGQFGNEWSGV